MSRTIERIKMFITVIFIIGLIYMFFSIGGCQRPNSTVMFLENQGYTEVEITGWRPFMGDKGDTFSTGFKAKNSNGKICTGAVTEGLLFKGKTIRFD